MTTEASKAPAAPPSEAEDTLELVDERQILDELQGIHFENDKFVYPVHGGFALTYKAIKLACRMFEERGEVLEVVGDLFTKYDEKDPEYLIVHVKVQRVKITPKGQRILMGSEVGTKRKWIKETLKDKTVRLDPSFYEKACAQAQRNAKQALLPQDFLLEFKDLIIKKGGAKGVPASRPAQQSQPAKTTTPAAAAKSSAPAGDPANKTPNADNNTQPPADAQKGVTPGNPPSDPSKRKLTMQQQFWVVFKSAIPQAKNEKQQRSTLKRFTGKTHVKELDEAVIQKLGPALRKVAEGESAIREVEGADGVKVLAIYHAPSSLFHWPVDFKPKAVTQPAAATQQTSSAPVTQTAAVTTSVAADPEAAPPEGEEKMF